MNTPEIIERVKVEAKIVEDALKTLGEEVQLKDIVDLTKDTVHWTSHATSKMTALAKRSGRIAKVGRGKYKFSEDPEGELKPKIGRPKGSKNKVNTKNKRIGKVTSADHEVAVSVESYQQPLHMIDSAPSIEVRNNDIALSQIKKKDQELLHQFKEETKYTVPPKKPKYKVGDVVEGYISGVEDYGAFVENAEGISGLIHITQIEKEMTHDVRRRFRVGDKVKAKVVRVKQDGKVGLSTMDFENELPDYFVNNALADKLQPVADLIKEEASREARVEPVAVSKPPVAEAPQEIRRVEVKAETVEPSGDSRYDKELEQVYKFIQTITGVVSNESKGKIKEMIEQKGMFGFMLALTEVSKDFKVDVSMMFTKAIEDKMRGGL